jgi:16S rRNA (guanine527-N7)-methyltransferase
VAGAGHANWRAPDLHDRAPLPADPSRCPPLPPDAQAALADGLAAMGLGDLPSPAVTALADHLRLLLAWTGAVNLTAIRDPRAAVAAHVLDALAALPLLREYGVRALLDLGSGGGYPGLPLAIALPTERALLVDSIGKKARFLATAVTGLGLADRVEVAAERAETLAADPRHRGRWPAVTARAVAALPELVELAFPLLAPGGLLVAWKRSEIGEERLRAMPALAALGGGTLDVLQVAPPVPAGHVLVVCRKTGRTPASWPRPSVERARHPW